jgi:O-antigen ligase
MNVAHSEIPERAAVAPTASRRPSDGSGLFWLLAGLLILMTTVPLPNSGIWLGAKAFAVEAVAIVLAVMVVSGTQWTRARVIAAATAAPNVAIAVFLLWVGVSAARSDLPELSHYEGMRYLGGGLIYFSVVYGFSVRRHLGKLVAVLLLVASLAALLAFMTTTDGQLDRLSGALRNEQLLAGFLCLSLPVILVVSQMDDEPWRRHAGQAAAVIVIAGVLVCKNRSAWLGSLVGLVVLGILYVRYTRRGKPITFGRHLLLLPIATIALAGTLVFAVSRMEGGLGRRAVTLSQLGTDSSFQWRLAMWNKCLRMAHDRPVAGWGIGTYPVQQALYYHPNAPSRSQRDIVKTGPRLTEDAHNLYLQLAAEIGYGGLALYLAVLACFFVTALRALRDLRPGFRHAILIGTVASIASQMVAAIGTPAWEFPECSLFFWLILAIGMTAAGLGNRGREPRPTARSVQQ